MESYSDAMRMKIEEARVLAIRVMVALDHSEADAAIVADHLIDCELRGLHYGGHAASGQHRRTAATDRGS